MILILVLVLIILIGIGGGGRFVEVVSQGGAESFLERGCLRGIGSGGSGEETREEESTESIDLSHYYGLLKEDNQDLVKALSGFLEVYLRNI